MKQAPSKFLESYRVSDGPLKSDPTYGMNGAFWLPLVGEPATFVIVVSDLAAWDHVSVHIEKKDEERRIPTWDEMEYIRKLFFRGDEWVMQLHAPADKHINMNPYTLHLWRPQKQTIPIPPAEMV